MKQSSAQNQSNKITVKFGWVLLLLALFSMLAADLGETFSSDFGDCTEIADLGEEESSENETEKEEKKEAKDFYNFSEIRKSEIAGTIFDTHLDFSKSSASFAEILTPPPEFLV